MSLKHEHMRGGGEWEGPPGDCIVPVLMVVWSGAVAVSESCMQSVPM